MMLVESSVEPWYLLHCCISQSGGIFYVYKSVHCGTNIQTRKFDGCVDSINCVRICMYVTFYVSEKLWCSIYNCRETCIERIGWWETWTYNSQLHCDAGQRNKIDTRRACAARVTLVNL